jgi:hypothetical protein
MWSCGLIVHAAGKAWVQRVCVQLTNGGQDSFLVKRVARSLMLSYDWVVLTGGFVRGGLAGGNAEQYVSGSGVKECWGVLEMSIAGRASHHTKESRVRDLIGTVCAPTHCLRFQASWPAQHVYRGCAFDQVRLD